MSAGVYFLKSAKFDLVKIGCAKDVEKRVDQINSVFPEPLELLFVVRTGSYAALEKEFHLHFRPKKGAKREWFRISADEAEQFLREWSIQTEIVHNIDDFRGLSRSARLDYMLRTENPARVECSFR